MAYLLIFSVLYILYEVTAYFCCERTNPDWVYRVSKDDLSTIKNTIAGKRKEFSDHNNLWLFLKKIDWRNTVSISLLGFVKIVGIINLNQIISNTINLAIK